MQGGIFKRAQTLNLNWPPIKEKPFLIVSKSGDMAFSFVSVFTRVLRRLRRRH